MQIKVFKAPTMKEAMAAMKAELGDDAVILHSKKYKEGGLLGIGSKEVVEITAAVEESALPEREVAPKPTPRPTLFSNAASRYKTSGTAAGVAQAEKNAEELTTPAEQPLKVSARPTLIKQEKILPVTQSDSLAEKISAQNKIPSLAENISEPEPKFEEVLQESIEDEQPAEVESQSDAEILNEADEVEEEKISVPEPVVEEVEENLPEEEILEEAEEELADEEEYFLHDEETPPETSESESEEVTEEISDGEVEEVAEDESESETEVEEKNSEDDAEKNSDAEEIPPEEKISAPESEVAEQTAEPETTAEEKSDDTEKVEPLPTQPGAELTQEQLAQAQAMMFAQFNQMQMAQVMQQAVAQAQAQAQLQVAEMAKQMREVHRQRMENSGQTPPPTAQVEQEEQDKIQRLEDEIAHMKALLAEVLGKESKKGGISLHEALRRQEVDEDILTEMATHAGAGDTLVDSKSSRAKMTLSAYLSEHLRFADGIKLNRHGVRLVALLGTTGVGKTTTLAKIAAKFVLEHGVNAALITADTYRISAVDQLKTYSEILGLPLEIVYTPEELKNAIEKHKHKELVLIDTAGRSQQNVQQMRELEEFLRVNNRIEKHLVISATTKLTDAQEIISKFSAVNPEKIIVTKIDETGSLGMIINLMRNKKLSLSYITTGQSVPDDIELATADILTDLILKKVVI